MTTIKSSRLLKLFLTITLLGSLAVITICVVLNFFQFNAYGPYGPYSIAEVILTSELDQDGQPVNNLTKFTPSQTINCWVRTRGHQRAYRDALVLSGSTGLQWIQSDRLAVDIHLYSQYSASAFTQRAISSRDLHG